MSAWDQYCVDMDGLGHITFGAGRSGAVQFGMMHSQTGSRPPTDSHEDCVEFTWHGFDEAKEYTGHRHARIVAGELQGKQSALNNPQGVDPHWDSGRSVV